MRIVYINTIIESYLIIYSIHFNVYIIYNKVNKFVTVALPI